MPKIKTDRGIIKYKTHPLFLGVKRIDKVKAKENLLLFKRLCDESGLYFGLIAGTLLGAVREKDFIAHDEDIDIFFLSEDKNRVFNIFPELIAQGFAIARYDRRGLVSIIRNGEYIDLYFFAPYERGMRICSGWCIPEKYFLDTAFIPFQGEQFLAPIEYVSYLEFQYGKNWETPIPYTDFKVSKWKVTLFMLKEKGKDLLPDWLYFKLAKRRERQVTAFWMSKID